MEEIFTPQSDNCTSGQSGDTSSDILHLSPEKGPDLSFETKLKGLLDQQLVQPKQETIDKILRYSRRL